jgi:hypothetical protein
MIPNVISDEEIKVLREEAADVEDFNRVEICNRALGGDEEATIACARMLLGARAAALAEAEHWLSLKKACKYR